jgi:uncharacterized protein (TIGR03435 family)
MVKTVVLAGLIATACRAQPAFEVASVKATPPSQQGPGRPGGCRGGPGTSSPGSWNCTDMPLFDLIRWAWQLKLYQVNAPEWIRNERFDVTAKFPQGTTREQSRLMEQNLLTERFQLTLHHEQKQMPVYELTVAKDGPKLKGPSPQPEGTANAARSRGVDAYGCPLQPPGWGGMFATRDRRLLGAPNSSIDDLAANLSSFLGRPVLNATGLTGPYDILLCFVPDNAVDPEPGPTLPAALREQLGLKLESKAGAIDVVVIDHAEKTPIEDPNYR